MAEVDLAVACDATVPSKPQFQQWADLALQGLGNCSVAVKVVDEAESRQLNKQWRGKDKPTNVLSFPGEELPGAGEFVLGDIAICAAVVEREAAEQGKPSEQHWAHMLIHGLLHLRGYDHIDDAEAEEMEEIERELLAQLSIPDPYTTVL